jgi:ligand-binding SRPBCC domain-containing protein
MFELHRETVVAAPPAEVWAEVTAFAGVNAELMPLCRMVEPRVARGRTLDSWTPGERAACWLLAGGIVPFDRHLLGIERVEPGVGFVEESTTWLQRRWRHERILTPVGAGTRVIDHLTVEPRLALAEPATRWMVGRIFDHRHRRLSHLFGANR